MSKRIWQVTLGLYMAACLGISVYLFVTQGVGAGLTALAALAYLLAFPLAKWLFHIKTGYAMETLWIVFLFAAFTLGTTLKWYSLFACYDLIVHTISGMLAAMTGVCLYARLRPADRRGLPLEPGLAIGTAFLSAQTVAGIWEILEYTGWLLTGHDSQNVATTGVSDTMEDMMVCLAGSVVVCLLLAWHVNGHRLRLFYPMEEWLRTLTPAAADKTATPAKVPGKAPEASATGRASGEAVSAEESTDA